MAIPISEGGVPLMSYSPALAGAGLATPVCHQGCLGPASMAQLQVVGLNEEWGGEGWLLLLCAVCLWG